MNLSDFEKQIKVLKVTINGNTYNIKDKLKKLGYIWNNYQNVWEKISPNNLENEFSQVEKYLAVHKTTFNIHIPDTKDNYFLEKELMKNINWGKFLTILE